MASEADESPQPGAVTGANRDMLRLEGFTILGLTAMLYSSTGDGWLLFALLFFAPDLSLLAYIAGPRKGAAVYNICHTYTAPLMLLAISSFAFWPIAQSAAMIWIAHIGFDRAFGWGLKYPVGFQDTHLGRIGRPRFPV